MPSLFLNKIAGCQSKTLIKGGIWSWWSPVSFCNIFRSSHPVVFLKKGVLENFAKITRKHLCQSLRPATKETLTVFRNLQEHFLYETSPVAASEYFREVFLWNTSKWLTGFQIQKIFRITIFGATLDNFLSTLKVIILLNALLYASLGNYLSRSSLP